MNQYQKAMQSHFVAQWITSLAISVICCAVLFVVFAGYIVQLHEKAITTNIRLEVVQERQQQLENEIAVLKRFPLIQAPSAPQQPQAAVQTPDATQPAAEPQTALPNGVSITEKAADELGKPEATTPAMPTPAPVPATEKDKAAEAPKPASSPSINLPPVEPKKTLPLVR